MDEIGKAANRPLNTGFFFGTPGEPEHIYEPEEKPAPYDFAAVVTDYDAGYRTSRPCSREARFVRACEVEFVGPGGRQFEQVIGDMEDEDGNPLDVARHPLQSIRLRTELPVAPLDLMRKRTRLISTFVKIGLENCKGFFR